ncbi:MULTISPECIES: RDD family protein [Niallia]|uniref:RDD family protein n=1 Tax=Niallia hominis TaxID=3133173 RepID=A0ABV1EXL5_9BACI|nr:MULTISPECIES: RDD family protein [Niallia]MCF2648703.1 RDD family protein [Niallia circulans]MCM3363476.1 RDD family protein [Niallia sp. MER TA 168]
MSNNRENIESESSLKDEELSELTVSLNETVESKEQNLNVGDSKLDSKGKVSYVYAGFWMRFWAYLADIVIVSSVNRILIYPILRIIDVPLHESSIFSTVNICTAITFYLYFVLMTLFLKQTLGKMIFGLKVIPMTKERLTWDTILFREWIGRFISGSFIILYALVAFLPKKQGLHDLFADTAVIHDR